MPEISQPEFLDGSQFREMILGSTAWLEKNVREIDAINVFPVPDGDTGTNMLLTVRSALDESYRAPDGSVSAIGDALAHGALMGARGNSGVIMSQVFRGLAQALEGKDCISSADLAFALKRGSDQAYRGVAQPTEGTMLTVMRDASDAACGVQDGTPVGVLEAAVDAARESVARTPMLLPVLREAGVVDAGGQGFLVFLEGALGYLNGEKPGDAKMLVLDAVPLALRIESLSAQKEEPYGYCTEFIIEGERLDVKKVMGRMSRRGKSVAVVGDENMLRVHVHTLDPGLVLHYALSKGRLHHIKIENMDEQNKGFVQAIPGERGTAKVAIVAVASGRGLERVFRSLGAAQVVQGGQTMNPSVREMLKAVENIVAEAVILLPNNKNVVQCAAKVPSIASKKVVVVPTLSMPQGIAALLAFNFETGLEENAVAMKSQAERIRTVEITKAVRSTGAGEIRVKRGQIIGLLDDCLVVAGDTVEDVLMETVDKADAGSAELITVYSGSEVEATEVLQAKKRLSDAYPGIEIEFVNGEQPHYHYIASVE